MWKPPAITDFIKISELFWFGVLILFLVIITYPDEKNQYLLMKSKTEKEVLVKSKEIDISPEKWRNIDQSKYIKIQKKNYQNALDRQAYKSAMEIAKDLILLETPDQLYWLKEFKRLSDIIKEYDESLNFYLQVFNKTNNIEIKKFLFIEIIKIYQAKEDYVSIKNFLSKYHKDFLSDYNMAYFILRTALATGDPKFSSKIASNIKEEHIK